MIERYSSFLTDKLLQHTHLNAAPRSVYQYGFELFLSTSASTTTILLMSASLSMIDKAVLFLVIFMPIRFFAGGYHASTYRNCFILTNSVYWLSLEVTFVIENLPGLFRLAILLTITVLSVITIDLFSPIRNSKHPLSQKRYLRNKIIARIISTLMGCGNILFLLLSQKKQIGLPSVTLMVIAVMMIIAKVKERRV